MKNDHDIDLCVYSTIFLIIILECNSIYNFSFFFFFFTVNSMPHSAWGSLRHFPEVRRLLGGRNKVLDTSLWTLIPMLFSIITFDFLWKISWVSVLEPLQVGTKGLEKKEWFDDQGFNWVCNWLYWPPLQENHFRLPHLWLCKLNQICRRVVKSRFLLLWSIIFFFFFFFKFETGYCQVPGWSWTYNHPSSVSQVTGITDVQHLLWLAVIYFARNVSVHQ